MPQPDRWLLLLLCWGAMLSLPAQDANHWTQQYGAYATLLGGAVIGSSSGLASTYYNPGRLVLSDSATVVVSAKAYQLTTLTIENATGDGREVKNNEIGGSPDLVAGFLPSRKLGSRSRLAYSILHRYDGTFDLVTRAGIENDVLPGIPGDEFFGGELQYNYKVNDFWVGFTFSHRLGERLGLGVTQFVSIRSQRFNRRVFYEALLPDGRTATASQFQEFNYFKTSLVWRLGLSGNIGANTTWGLSMTTPYLNLFGKGYVLYNELIAGGDLTGDGVIDDRLTGNQQDDRPARFRNGWSLGAGASTLLGRRIRAHLSAEYFSEVGRYDLVDAEPFEGQSNGQELEHFVAVAQEGLLNFGIGLEIEGGEKLDYYASFATDLSPTRNEEDLVNSSLGTDLMHIGGGTSLRLGRVDLNLGLVYSFGNNTVTKLSDLYVPPGWGLSDEEGSGAVKWRRIKFIFGISVN